MKASVILPVYDAPRSLTLVFEGYRRQTTRDFELVVADDGSPPAVKAIVKKFTKTAPFKVKYLWQEDMGFRKAKAMNEGVKISEGDWLIFSDGDCIPHRDSVKAHIKMAKPNSFCGGAYIYLPADYSKNLMSDMVAAGDYEKFLTIGKKCGFTIRHLRYLVNHKLHIGRVVKAWGANNSMDRKLFYDVNGYDENYNNISGEDGDMKNRLLRFGAKPISVWNSSFVFHLDDSTDVSRFEHPPLEDASKYSFFNRPDDPASCENGLVKKGKYAGADYDPPKIGF